jgi:hypothetical protein
MAASIRRLTSYRSRARCAGGFVLPRKEAAGKWEARGTYDFFFPLRRICLVVPPLRANVPTTIRRKHALGTAIPSNWMASFITICVSCTSTATRIHRRGRKMRICRPTISKVDSTERRDTERTQCDAKPSISISRYKARQVPTDSQILCIIGFFIASAILANVGFFYFAALHASG